MAGTQQSGPTFMRRLWMRLRLHVKAQPWFASLLVWLITGGLRFINWTNPRVAGSHNPDEVYAKNSPMIVAFWHGQHVMAPFLAPKNAKAVALFSKSADAELNAKIVEKFGFETVRGSGGREPSRMAEKGGARALLSLKRALDQAKSVVMIADISKSTAREAGLGVITLAKISGRPIIAAAYASSRRKVLEKTWDKTTINLPFGRAAAFSAEPLYVPQDADDVTMEALRQELTKRLNDATANAFQLLEAKP